jgi:hypothetical protein
VKEFAAVKSAAKSAECKTSLPSRFECNRIVPVEERGWGEGELSFQLNRSG